jgi:hypothetical protein
MGDPPRDLQRLRVEVESLRGSQFDERAILSLLRRLLKTFGSQLPKARIEQRRNKWIGNNFGIPDVGLIMIEPVHGPRSAIPLRWRHQMLDTVEEILDRVEAMTE